MQDCLSRAQFEIDRRWRWDRYRRAVGQGGCRMLAHVEWLGHGRGLRSGERTVARQPAKLVGWLTEDVNRRLRTFRALAA